MRIMDCNAIGHLIKDKRSQYVNIKKYQLNLN